MNYYIADLHFGHANAISFDNRPVDSVEEMNDALIVHGFSGGRKGKFTYAGYFPWPERLLFESWKLSCNVFGFADSNDQVINMVKLRDARYCNLKLLLIFLVIYGHLIEPGIYRSKVLMTQYKWIYLFHMPLFSFLSGLFLRDDKACGRQFIKMLPLYIVLQVLAVWLGNGKVKPLTPYWHLWYLLSYSAWVSLGWLWFRVFRGKSKFAVLSLTILAGCLAGLHPDIGREHSLSRTLVFLPYFWMGLICAPRFRWERLRWVFVVTVTDVYVELRPLERPLQGNSFSFNGWNFIKYNYEIEK